MTGRKSQGGATQRLVEAAQAGDRGAFDELAGGLRTRLEAVVRTRLGDRLREEVDDVLQECLLQAFQSVKRFDWQGEDSFFRWLSGIAEHAILKAARYERRHPKLRLERDVPGDAPSPSKGLLRDERFERFEKAVEGLAPNYREVILLARIEGLSVKQISERLNRSEDAVMQLLSRALRKLRAAFGETESFHLAQRRLVNRSAKKPPQSEERDGKGR